MIKYSLNFWSTVFKAIYRKSRDLVLPNQMNLLHMKIQSMACFHAYCPGLFSPFYKLLRGFGLCFLFLNLVQFLEEVTRVN